MLRQIHSLISNFKDWFTNVKEAKLEEENPGCDKYSWPGPNQWYQGPLEVFTQSEEGPSDYQAYSEEE
jgi:hypothetical protein